MELELEREPVMEIELKLETGLVVEMEVAVEMLVCDADDGTGDK